MSDNLDLNKHDTCFVLIILYTAGVAVLLTIITYFSTPILTKIFGDGALEVGSPCCKDSLCFWNIRVTTRGTGRMMRVQQMRR